MDHSDWLGRLVDVALGRADTLEARVRGALGDLDDDPDEYGVRRAVAQDWLERSMRERGLAYGVPIPDPELDCEALAADPHASAFLIALRHQVELCLEVAVAFGRDLHEPKLRRKELALLLVRLTGGHKTTGEMEAAGSRKGPVVRALRLAGQRLAEGLDASRAHPPWALAGAHANAARRLGQLALDLHERRAGKERVGRRLDAMASDACLAAVEAMAGAAWSDGEMPPEERRLIEERIALSGFTRAERRQALRAVAHPRPPAEIAEALDDPQAGRFVLQQVILECHADGRIDPRESAYVVELAEALGMSQLEVARIEADIAAFYERHAEHLHRAEGAGAMRSLVERTTGRITEVVRDNSAHLMQEIRETQDLSRLLLRAGTGQGWTAEERERAKRQLLDICKSVPALAIVAMPGGGLLLPILIKVLPFNVLPSAFAGSPDRTTAGETD
jgi:tellurite resistance protein